MAHLQHFVAYRASENWLARTGEDREVDENQLQWLENSNMMRKPG